MAKKPEPVQENTAPPVDPQKEHLANQFGGLMDQVGEGFGGPLQEELIRRLEQTIADFHEEVNEMLTHLKDNSEKRHEKLKEIWDNPDGDNSSDSGNNSDDSHDDGVEMSAYEKRLEGMADKEEKAPPAEPEEKPKKKKGFFGRKKK